MKITVLAENTSTGEPVEFEHGLSVLVEMQNAAVLFDTGCGEMFLRNADRLGVDVSRVTHLILSHGHFDHAGGIPAFLERNSRASVFLRWEALNPAFVVREGNLLEYAGAPQGIASSGRLAFTRDGMEIAPGVTLYSDFESDEPMPDTNRGLLTDTGDGMIPDGFAHEQVAEIREGGKTLLLTGCSHHGIGNILRNYRTKSGCLPDYIIGGFHLHSHLSGAAGAPLLDAAAEAISASGATAYTCHCTGLPSYEGLKTRLGDRIGYLCGGQAITI